MQTMKTFECTSCCTHVIVNTIALPPCEGIPNSASMPCHSDGTMHIPHADNVVPGQSFHMSCRSGTASHIHRTSYFPIRAVSSLQSNVYWSVISRNDMATASSCERTRVDGRPDGAWSCNSRVLREPPVVGFNPHSFENLRYQATPRSKNQVRCSVDKQSKMPRSYSIRIRTINNHSCIQSDEYWEIVENTASSSLICPVPLTTYVFLPR